ncbi:MAG: glutathione S-transferase N-terminal domain-containing protein [Persicimonas sp.]
MSLIGGVVKSMLQMSHLNDAHSWVASTVRGPRGLIVNSHNRQHPPRPEQPLELYEFEACPFCRKVREAMTELDLAYVNRTCAKGSEGKRARVEARGGKQQFPYLVDPNTGTELYESEDIITYLAETYGPGRSALGKVMAPANTGFAMAASVVRPKGGRVRGGYEDREQPEQLLTLYNMEASPYCRKVRETLNELDLDYRVENVGKLSARRPELVERGGEMMVPYFVDPNTDTAMYESDAIVDYLEATYG